MKINKIEVFGYGKWVNQTFDIHPQLQVFAGPNEAGKSSIKQFITGILFGFPNREKGRYAFDPLQGGQTGGRLYITDQTYGDLIIERAVQKDKMVLTCLKPNGEQVDPSVLEQLLYNVSEDQYKAVYAFDLAEMQEFGMLEKEQLNRQLLSIGVSGSEQLLKVADQFQKQADAMYTPRSQTREIDKKMKELTPIAESLANSKQNNEVYQRAALQRHEQLAEKTKQSERMERLAKQQMTLQKIVEQYPAYDKWQQLQRQVTTTDYSRVSDDGLYQLEHALEDSEHLENEQQRLQEELFHVQTKNETMSQTQWTKEQKTMMEALLAQQEELYQLEQTAIQLQRTINDKTQQKDRERQQYGVLSDDEVPEPLEEQEREQVRNWLDQRDHIVEQQQHAEHDLTRFDQKLEELQANIDRIQTEAQQHEPVEQLRQQVRQLEEKSRQQQGAISNQLGLFGTLFVAIVLFIIGFLLPDLRLGIWIGGGVVLLRLLFQAVMQSMKQRHPVAERTDQSVEQLQTTIQQLERLEAAKEVYHNEEIALGEKKRVALEQLHNYSTDIQTIDTALTNWLQQSSYRTIRGIQLAELVQHDLFDTYRRLQRELVELTIEHEGVASELAQFEQQMAFFWQYSAEQKPTSLRLQFEKVKDAYHQLLSAEKDRQHLAERQVELSEQLTVITQRIETKKQIVTNLLATAEVTSVEEFKQFWNVKVEQEKVREQVQTLSETVKHIADEAAQYENQAAAESALQAVQLEYETTRQMYLTSVDQLATIEQQIEQLEKDGTYIVWEQQYEQKATDTRALIVQWAAHQLASSVLTKTLLDGKEHYLKDILQDATYFFKRLTQARYTAIQFDKKEITVQRFDVKRLRLSQLSRGTLDQLYVALRLAFVKNTTTLAPLPLLIDDGFVNFDSERTEIVLDLLKEISRTTQLIYFTFAQNVTDYISEEHIIPLQRTTNDV